MHLGAVAGGDGFGERGEFGGVAGEGVQGDAVALLGGEQAVQLGLGDGVAVVGGAVGLAAGDLGEQGFVFRLPLVFA